MLGLKGKRGVGPLRPIDDEIEKGLVRMSIYFDALVKLPSHRSMISYFASGTKKGKSPAEFRGGSDRNILFRPIAQVALARAIAWLQANKNAELKDLLTKVSRHEASGELNLTSKKTPWFGILCDPIDEKVRRQKKYEDLCVDMLTYLLGDGFGDDEKRQSKLLNDFFEARRGGTDSNEPKAWDLSGDLKTKDEFSLPDPWR